MKKKYIKLRLEVDIEVSEGLFKVITEHDGLDAFVKRNIFHNNAWSCRHKNLTQITEEEFKSK